jgi:hypothetical protein
LKIKEFINILDLKSMMNKICKYHQSKSAPASPQPSSSSSYGLTAAAIFLALGWAISVIFGI